MTRLILVLCTLLMVTLMILISYTGTGEGAGFGTFKISRNGKQVSEKVKVDVKKNLEMYIVREPESAKKATLVIMYDFNKVKKNSKIKVLSKTEEVIKKVGKLNRHMYSKVLGKEMERLCKGLPIFLVTPAELNDIERVNDSAQESDEIQEKTTSSKRQVGSSCGRWYCWYEKKCWCEEKCRRVEKCKYLSEEQRQCPIPV